MNVIRGKVFDVQRFSIHDGPGIRTDVFLKGCPLRCLWCHSPESQALGPQLAWFEMRCIGVGGCGRCLIACPKGAIRAASEESPEGEKREIQIIEVDRDACDDCGHCAEACPAQALSIAGSEMTVDEVLALVEKDRPYYRKSGGGITISGGEPMVQHEFLTALLKESKARGLHVCLDTSGYASPDRYDAVIEHVDLFLYDLKHMDLRKHRSLTGVSNELILDNAIRMAAKGALFQIRVPVVPGLTDSEENLRAVSEFCVRLGSAVELVQMLPYHRLGISKYGRFQKRYELETVVPPSDEQMESCRAIIESYGLKVRIH